MQFQAAFSPASSASLSATQTRPTNYRPHASPSHGLSETRVLVSGGGSPAASSASFNLPLTSPAKPSPLATSTTATPVAAPRASPSKPRGSPNGVRRSASDASSKQSGGGGVVSGAKWFDKSQQVARSQQAHSAAIAKALGQVRALERDVRPSVGYLVASSPMSAPRPSSASVILPPLGGATAADPSSASTTSSLFNRTAPLATSSVVTSVHSPIAGVDDPVLHAHVNVSVTGQSFQYSSQRLHNLAVSRQTRHFAALNAYHDWRLRFERDLTQQAEEVESGVREELDKIERPLRTLLFETMASETHLLAMSVQAIREAEHAFHDNYARKTRAIEEARDRLEAIEETRERDSTKQLDDLARVWLQTSHLLVEECEEHLAVERGEVQAQLMKNRGAAEELTRSLQSELVDKQREEFHSMWLSRFDTWRRLRHDLLIRQFREQFMHDEPEPHENEIDPRTGHPRTEPLPERALPFQYSRTKRRAYDALIRVEKEFAAWSDAQVLELIKLTPVAETSDLKPRIDLVAERLQVGYLDYDTRMEAALEAVRTVETDLQARAEEMVQSLVWSLVETGAVAESGILAQVEAEVRPLLAARATRESDTLSRVERSLRHFDAAYLAAIDHISRFLSVAGERWDRFLTSLREVDLAASEALAERRDRLDDEEASLEAQLKESISYLEYEPTMPALEARLKEVRGLVGPEGSIEQAFRHFFDDAMSLVGSHPEQLSHTAAEHSSGMAEHFGLRNPADLAKAEALAAEAAAAAALEAARLEEEEDAKLSKRDRVKRDKEKEKAKKDREREEATLAETEAKARLAKAKELAAQTAKAKSNATVNANATAATEESSRPSSRDRTGSAERTRGSAASGVAPPARKKTEEELLRELSESESREAAVREVDLSIERGLFYSLARFHDASVSNNTVVKEKRETPLEELGRVVIQSGELEPPPFVHVEHSQADTVLTSDEVRAFVVIPPPPPEEEAPSRVTRAAAHSRSPSKVLAAVAPTPYTPPPLPHLALPPEVLQFRFFLSHAELIERMIAGERTAAATETASDLVSEGGEAGAAAGGFHLRTLSASGAGSLETAAERSARKQAAAERAAEEAAAAQIQQIQSQLTGDERPKSGDNKTASAATASGAKPKRKTAKELAREEKAARAAADEIAAARAAEEARKEAVRLAAESVPFDEKGVALLEPVRFPRDLLASFLERVRESFLVALEYEARQHVREVRGRNESLAMDLVKELNLKQRQYRPRFSRIEVDVYETRAKSLSSNLDQYNRLISRLTGAYGSGVGGLEPLLLRGEKEVRLFTQRARERMDDLVRISTDPHASLASLHGVNTALKQQRLGFTKVMTGQVLRPLTDGLTALQTQTTGKIRDFLRTCEARTFGSNARAAIEEVDEEGNVIGGVSGGAGKESYHPDEVAYYAGLLEEFARGFDALLDAEREKVTTLNTKYESALALQEFNDAYAVALQNVAIAQGLGHHNGAPKRTLTVAIRSEYHKSQSQARFIDTLLDEVARANEGLLRVGRVSSAALKKKKTNEDEKESSSLHGTPDDLATAFTGLQLATPTATNARTLTTHLLRTLDQLRQALFARAQYLAALKPNLPPFVLAPVSIDVEDDAATAAAAAAKAAEERRLAEEASSSKNSRSRGGGAAAAASSVSEKRKSGGSLPSGSVAGGGKKTSSSSSSKKDDDTLATDPNKGEAPTFMEVVVAQVDVCKRDMHAIVTAYETQYPDRKPRDPATSASEKKESEEEVLSGSTSRRKEAAAAGAAGAKERKASRKGAREKEALAEATPDTLVLPPAIEEHCAGELARSSAHLESARTELLRQADRAAQLLQHTGRVVLGDVFGRIVSDELAHALDSASARFDTRLAHWSRSSVRHRERLKPALASRPDRSLLDLVDSEDRRFSEAVQGIKDHRRATLRTLDENGRKMVQQLVHATTSLLALVDSMVLPIDLANVLQDGEALAAGRKSLHHLVKEAHRLAATKQAIAKQAGIAIDELGQIVPPAAAATPAPPAGTKTRAGSGGKKRTSAQIAADAAAAAESLAATQELMQRLDPRYIRLTWPGLRVDQLVQPVVDEDERRAIEAKKAQEAAAAAAAAAAVENATDSRKKKRGKAAAAAAAAVEEESASERTNGGSGASSPTGSPRSSGRASGPTSPLASPHARRTGAGGKKQKAEEEAAALAAAAAAALAAEAQIQTPSVSGLNQPTQRAVISSRDAIFQQYVALYHQQVESVIAAAERQLAAEEKARREWEDMVSRLRNPDPVQF